MNSSKRASLSIWYKGFNLPKFKVCSNPKIEICIFTEALDA
jgi:hypothetical protein